MSILVFCHYFFGPTWLSFLTVFTPTEGPQSNAVLRSNNWRGITGFENGEPWGWTYPVWESTLCFSPLTSSEMTRDYVVVLCLYSNRKTSTSTIDHINAFVAEKPSCLTLIKELMTIAPAFTIGLCGLSATRARYHSFAPNHKSNKPLPLQAMFQRRNVKTSANKPNKWNTIHLLQRRTRNNK